jgi:hypothetical protein
LRRIDRDLGPKSVADIDEAQLRSVHKEWSADGHMAMAHSLVGMLRTLATHGETALKRRDCRELRITVRDVKFERAQPRTARLTAAQARDIIKQAHKMGLHSIALAQALQFECALKQKDVIGEWVPESEPGDSELRRHDGLKWVHGIRWSEIDKDFVLRHVTSMTGNLVTRRLSEYPMVRAELQRIGDLPSSGPVIVNEYNDVPYSNHEFRRKWRIVARAAGVPDHVYNMDSSLSAQDEATEDENQPL